MNIMRMLQGCVHIVDDNRLFLDSWAKLLKSNFENIRTYESSIDFRDKYIEHEIECLLLDISLPGELGTELFYQLNELNITLPCIFISNYGSIELAVQLMRDGAFSFIEKSSDMITMIKEIRRAFEKCKVLKMSKTLLNNFNLNLLRLSKKEYKAFELMLYNYTISQMADEMNISNNTVEKHRSKVLLKLNFKTTQELVLFCTEHKYKTKLVSCAI